MDRAPRTSWRDLTPRQRRLVVVGGAIEVALTSYAARDLAARPQSQVRGPRRAWWLVLVVQPVGPLTYLLWGRRP